MYLPQYRVDLNLALANLGCAVIRAWGVEIILIQKGSCKEEYSNGSHPLSPRILLQTSLRLRAIPGQI